MLQVILDLSLFQWFQILTIITLLHTIECNSDRKPAEVKIRIPHPDGKTPSKVTGGIYDKATETVTIKPFSGKAEVRIEF